MRIPSLATLTVLIGLALSVAPEADGVEGRRGARRDAEDLIEGRLIVKYRDSVGSCMHCLLAGRLDLSGAVGKGGGRFKGLHDSHGVQSARPVFRLEDEEARAFPGQEVVSTLALRRYHRQRLEGAELRFQSRQSRAPRRASLPDLHHVYSVTLGRGQDPMAAAAAFTRNANVEYAHPDYLVRADLLSDDPFFESSGSWGQPYDDLWGLKSDQLDVERAWNVSQGEGVVVAVVDTGIDYKHEDLAANIWTNPREVAGNGIDDDRNGFVDDVLGFDFTTCIAFSFQGCANAKDPDNDPLDDNFHGTHVAGTIAAAADNGKGVVGVAPRAKLMAVKGLNQDGTGATADLAAAIVYAATNGADVINNSWGCGFCPSVPLYEDAMKTAAGLGSVVVFAAGNSSSDSRIRSPHNLRSPKPIVVAASAPENTPTYFTNFGASIDVAAPGGVQFASEGSNILSVRKAGKCRTCRRLTVSKRYLRLQGTSMAAPHVAGLAALVLSHRPGLTTDEVRQVLRTSSDDIELPGFDSRSGAGRINAARALGVEQPLEVKITKPRHLTAVRRQRATVRGTAAGSGFTDYQLFARHEADVEWTPLTGLKESPVRNGVLGSLPRSELDDGWSLLRLVATAADGSRYEDVVSLGRQARARSIAEDLPGMAFVPDISGDRIVWLQLEGSTAEHRGQVYLYDLGTKTRTKITEEVVWGAEPKISGDRVVWHDDFGDSEQHLYTCTIDSATGECPPNRVTGEGSYPVIAGDRMTFVDGRALTTIDLSTGARRDFGSGSSDFSSDGDLLVWRDTPRGEGERMDIIEVFDWTTETLTRVTSHKNILDLVLSGRQIIFWTRDADLVFRLRSYDLDTDSERILVEPFPPTSFFDSSGDRVVWPNISEIVTYDTKTDELRGAAILPLSIRSAPAISGDVLVWIDVQHSELSAGQLKYTRLK